MATSTKQNSAKKHDRSALIQWLALGLVVALGLVAALVLTDGSGNAVHGGVVLSPITS